MSEDRAFSQGGNQSDPSQVEKIPDSLYSVHIPNYSVWFVRNLRDKHKVAFKIVFKNNTIVGTESVILSATRHFDDVDMWLPKSYDPYRNQFWHKVNTGESYVLPGSERLDILEGTPGFEWSGRDYSDGIVLSSLKLRRCKIGDFDSMKSNDSGEQLNEFGNSSMPPHGSEAGEGLVVFAGSYHGKSTSFEAGESVDWEVESETLIERMGLTDESEIEELKRLTAAWTEVKALEKKMGKFDSGQADAQLNPISFRQARNEVYNEGTTFLINSKVPVVTSHLNEELLEVALTSGRRVAFLLLTWEEMGARSILDDPEDAVPWRILSMAGYYNTLVRLRINGPFFDTVGAAIATLPGSGNRGSGNNPISEMEDNNA